MLPFSVCLIAKNEEKNIGRCIDAIKPLIMACEGSEIVVADTGSTDNTVQVATGNGTRVLSYVWKNDFADARNFVARNAVNDLILFVDCDEFLISTTKRDFKAFADAVDNNKGRIGMSTIISKHFQGGELLSSRDKIGRFYDRRLFSFKGEIHENIRSLEGKETYFDMPLTFEHVGYDTPELRRNKAKRNIELILDMLGKCTGDPYLYYQAGKCYVMLEQKKDAIECYEKALELEKNTRLAYIQDLIVSYAYCLLEQKNFAKALVIEKYEESLGKYADYMFALGLVHMNNARFEDSINDFLRAAACTDYSVEGTTSYKAFYNIGVIYEVMGNTALAKEYYAKCGDYPMALNRLKVL